MSVFLPFAQETEFSVLFYLDIPKCYNSYKLRNFGGI